MAANGRYNQAGDLSPRTGAYSQAFRAALPGLAPPLTVLPYKHPYGGWIGALVIQNVADYAIVPGRAYNGVAPAGLQPTLTRPDPWRNR